MSAALHSDQTRTLAGSSMRVRVWAGRAPGESPTLVTCTLADSIALPTWDVYAIATAILEEYGQVQLVLDTGSDLIEVAEAASGGWVTAPISLADLAAGLGADPSEVLP